MFYNNSSNFNAHFHAKKRTKRYKLYYDKKATSDFAPNMTVYIYVFFIRVYIEQKNVEGLLLVNVVRFTKSHYTKVFNGVKTSIRDV